MFIRKNLIWVLCLTSVGIAVVINIISFVFQLSGIPMGNVQVGGIWRIIQIILSALGGIIMLALLIAGILGFIGRFPSIAGMEPKRIAHILLIAYAAITFLTMLIMIITPILYGMDFVFPIWSSMIFLVAAMCAVLPFIIKE